MKEVKKVSGNVLFLTVGDKYISIQLTYFCTVPVFIIFGMYSKFSLKCFYKFGHVRQSICIV